MPAKRILAINDSQEVLQLFNDILREEGYDVVVSSYAMQEINDVERIKPDLIIVDCLFNEEQMGWQLIQKLKMRRTTAAIPIVLCTAEMETVRNLEGHLRAKGVIVVLKPFDIEDLLAGIDHAFENIKIIGDEPEV
ncbi:MAG: response regulator [Herpetosiphon sp.]|nr:response regulator [Herpetosiphon sp.]